MKKFTRFNLCVLFLSSLLYASCQKHPEYANYVQRRAMSMDSSMKAPLRLIPLVPGAICPKGWIGDQARAAANGTTGHLDEWAPTFRDGWKGIGIDALGANKTNGTGWPLEQCAYWLDGAVRLAYILQDSALIEKVSQRLDGVVNGVLASDRCSFIHWTDIDLANSNFNNWASSHIGRALVAYYQATGDERILQALVKVYAHYPLQPLKNEFMSHNGIANIDPMLDTYRMSGCRSILDTILSMANTPSFRQTAEEWRQGRLATGHGVATYEDTRIPAIAYLCTGDTTLLRASESCYEWIEQNHMLPYGVASSEEHLAGIGSTRHTETCNVATSEWSYQKMFEITGDRKWGDRIERVFFNAAPQPLARDYQSLCYYQSPNRVQGVLPAEEPRNPANVGDRSYVYRPTGHDVLCCAGNSNRILPFYIMHMWAGTPDFGAAATLYGPSRVKLVAGKNDIPVEIVEETQYPFEETIRLTILPDKKVTFPLYLRIPGWCKDPQISVNGSAIEIEVSEEGFARIDRKWRKGDQVTLLLPMQPSISEGKETPFPTTPYFRENNRPISLLDQIDNPFRCVWYGPLLFSLPLPDIDANTQGEGEWRYALPSVAPEKIKITREEMPDRWDWPYNSPLKLEVPAKAFNWNPSPLYPLPAGKVIDGTDTTIVLIPYGCAKFRICMFPVAE